MPTLWNDKIYKHALKFIRLSFLCLVVFWLGIGFRNMPLMSFGALFAVILFGCGAFLILRMIWTEEEKK